MRFSTLFAFLVLLIPVESNAQPVKPVEVTNFPEVQSVEIVNPTTDVSVSNLPEVQAVEVVSQPACEAPSRIQLVGFTRDQYRANQGVLGFTRACQREFPESRMCSSVEVMETTSVPALSGESAWVRPFFVPLSVPVGTNDAMNDWVMDASGKAGRGFKRSGGSALTCSQWSTTLSSLVGLTVNGNGAFRTAGCSTELAVSCCALVP